MDAFVANMITWFQTNPTIVLLIVYVLFQVYQRNQPFPEVEGSKVRPIKSMEAYKKLLQECKETGSVLVVDAYAQWCPPCRAAAPVYGEMSKLYESDVIFAKVNVDEARDVAQAFSIQAMPTFKIFDGEGTELSSLQGWNESTLRDNIVKAVNAK